jgi:hypothetical protein
MGGTYPAREFERLDAEQFTYISLLLPSNKAILWLEHILLRIF